MGRYKAPRKFNFISIIIGGALLAGLYSLVMFGPVYYRKWQTKSVLSEAAVRAYGKRVFHDPDNTEKLEAVTNWSVARLRSLGVKDPGLSVNITQSSSHVTAEAVYTERINHPLVKKVTMLYFRPHNSVTKEGS